MAESDRRGMGRGLSAILPPAAKGQEGLREIPVELVAEPPPAAGSFDEDALAELAESIRARGVLQPIVVRALPGGHYELVAGERRLRAARMAELETVPGDGPRGGRLGAARPGARREHGSGRPQCDR